MNKSTSMTCPKCEKENVYKTSAFKKPFKDIRWFKCMLCTRNSKAKDWKIKLS